MAAMQLAAVCTFLLAAASVDGAGFYTIVAPRVIRPNSDYHVAVTTMDTSQPTVVTVQVTGRKDSGGNPSISQDLNVEPYFTKLARLQIGDLGPGKYKLVARGIDGVEFVNSTELTYVHKSYSVFVQTDRSVYKPGHTVKYRIVVLSPHLKPSVTTPIDIHVTDGKNNRVKEWRRVIPNKGVVTGELSLSQAPVLGHWTITVDIQDQSFSKKFEVAEYVLPKFEVTADMPDYTTFKENRIAATIRAKYTYGKPVKGEATVTAYPTYYSGILQPIYENPVRKVFPIDGKANVEFDIGKEFKLADEYTRTFQLDIAVEEALTGRRQNISKRITVHKHKYKMELIKTANYFKPGLKYTAYIKLSHHDGSPVMDDKNMVTVRYGYSYASETYTPVPYRIGKNGLIQLDFYPPANATTLGIEAKYLDLTEWFSTVDQSLSYSKSFIQAVLITPVPKVNEDVEIEVNSTDPLRYLSYQVMGRGDVVVAHSLPLGGEKVTRFRFLATHAMAPAARVIVYTMRQDGEVLADTIDVELQGLLQNYVDIAATPSTTEPGRDVEIRLETKPNSYIGLVGVDQRSLLLKAGNDFTEADVEEELRSYDPQHESSPLANNFRFRRSMVWRPGSATAKEVFDKSGTILMTNGVVMEPLLFEFYARQLDGREPIYDDDVALSVSQKQRAPATPNDASSPRIRKDFPETWLWEDLDTGYTCFALGQGPRFDLRAENRPAHRPIPARGVPVLKPDIGPPVAYEPATRPPLAGPYAFSRIPIPVWNHPKVFLTEPVADTWFFNNVSSGYDGKASIKRKVPDSITSWIITAFSVDPLYGLGLSPEAKKITVFRPFFVSVDLPYSVIRGEAVAIPIVVFNYMDRSLTAEVTLENSREFEFVDISNDINPPAPKLELYRRKRISVAPQSGSSLSFMITPTQLGYVTIRVTATSDRAGDAVEKKLLVKAEGETQYRNKAILVDLRNTNAFKTNVTLEIPKNVVPGSENIEVSAVGDILGPSIPNLANLIKMPHGCGEQNMLNFVPNIVIMEYLKNTQQLTQAIESRARNYLEIGYQQELTYRHDDGSFSAFGNSDPSGSTWLTAFVAKSFQMAKLSGYLNVEDNITDTALDWLASKQDADGRFPEVGKVSHTDMQGGAAKGLALTAYTLITFLYNQRISQKYRNTINKAVDYIVRNMDGLEDPYAIAITTYALHLAQHPTKDSGFNLLESKARTADELKWWNKTLPEGDEKNPWYGAPNAISVEMTAYAMLTYLERGLVVDSLPIMRWLIAQRNADGGFASTQDTVIGMQSLAALGERLAGTPSNVALLFTFKSGGTATRNINVNRANSMILQKQELPRSVRSVEISATGSGFAIVQVSYSFNINVTGAWPLFTLDPQVDKNSDANHLQLSICSGFVPGSYGNESNMAVMEVSLPSGFTADRDALPSLELSQNVRRVETKDGDTVVVLYFDKMVRREYCPTVSAFRTHKVARQKPVPVTIYDYYDQSRRARAFYEPRVATLCDISDENDSACSGRTGPRTGEGRLGEPDSATSISISLAAICSCVLFLLLARRVQ